MKFFIPHAQDEAEAESVYSGIKKFAKQQMGWDIQDTRIYTLRYKHNGKEYFAKVGEVETFTHDLVLAILRSGTYFVCTINRGGLRGEPIMVGDNEVLNVELFEE